VSTLRLTFSEKAAVNERTPTTDLLHHLIGQRAHLIAKMSNAHQRGGDVAGWLPLLAQTRAAITDTVKRTSELVVRFQEQWPALTVEQAVAYIRLFSKTS
jgi:hypothetical protein